MKKSICSLFFVLTIWACNSFSQAIEITSTQQLNSLIQKNPNVVIKFYAPWCPACNMIAPAFKEIASSPMFSHIKFAQVNTSQNKFISQSYSIRGIPTIVFIKNGQKVDEKIGFGAFDKDMRKKLGSLTK